MQRWGRRAGGLATQQTSGRGGASSRRGRAVAPLAGDVARARVRDPWAENPLLCGQRGIGAHKAGPHIRTGSLCLSQTPPRDQHPAAETSGGDKGAPVYRGHAHLKGHPCVRSHCFSAGLRLRNSGAGVGAAGHVPACPRRARATHPSQLLPPNTKGTLRARHNSSRTAQPPQPGTTRASRLLARGPRTPAQARPGAQPQLHLSIRWRSVRGLQSPTLRPLPTQQSAGAPRAR